ncbi:hypothetical protein GQ42DRAFT_164444 [Ramicandelaber brevisporus]|nr:hypothetical protein GQ42DRAFT_164444 [Ramicandelaber brevisporus]
MVTPFLALALTLVFTAVVGVAAADKQQPLMCKRSPSTESPSFAQRTLYSYPLLGGLWSLDQQQQQQRSLHKITPFDLSSSSSSSSFNATCSKDADCLNYDHGKGQKDTRLGEYACISSKCQYVVASGELCSRGSDCAAYQWLSMSNTASVDEASFCGPQFCTLESTCDGAWTLMGAPPSDEAPFGIRSSRMPPDGRPLTCCRGLEEKTKCGLISQSVDTCSHDANCDFDPSDSDSDNGNRKPRSSSSNGSSSSSAGSDDSVIGARVAKGGNTELNRVGRCVSKDTRKHIWIGILLCLCGGSVLNIGLNMQKKAYLDMDRKRAADEQRAAGESTDSTAATPVTTEETALKADGELNAVDDRTLRVDAVLLATSDDTQSTLAVPTRSALADDVITNADTPATASASLTADIASNVAPLDQNTRPHSLAGSTTRQHSSSNPASAPATVTRSRKSQLRRVLSALAFWRSLPLKNWTWLVGFVIFILGNIANFTALQFAPQSLVAPLGAVSLVTNVIVAPWLNKERLTRWDFGGIILIIGGCVMAVVFSGIVSFDYRLCVLINLLRATPTVVYLCIIGACIIAMFAFIQIVERAMNRRQKRIASEQYSGSHSADITHQQQQSTSLEAASSTPAAANDATLVRMPPKPEQNPSPPRKSISAASMLAQNDPTTIARELHFPRWLILYALPLAYATLGGLMATLTTLFAKSLINLLSVSIVQGQNQFNSFLAWVILIVTITTAISQVFWINKGLRRYDALLQVPVFYVVWTVFDIIGGGVYYNEFVDFTPKKYALFTTSIVIIFIGVGLLASRLKRLEATNVEIDKAAKNVTAELTSNQKSSSSSSSSSQ